MSFFILVFMMGRRNKFMFRNILGLVFRLTDCEIIIINLLHSYQSSRLPNEIIISCNHNVYITLQKCFVTKIETGQLRLISCTPTYNISTEFHSLLIHCKRSGWPLATNSAKRQLLNIKINVCLKMLLNASQCYKTENYVPLIS